MLSRDVLVTPLIRKLFGFLDSAEQRTRGLGGASGYPLGTRKGYQGISCARANHARIRTHGLEQGQSNALALLNESLKQVNGFNLRITGRRRGLERRSNGFVRFRCHLMCHEIIPPNGSQLSRRRFPTLLRDIPNPKLSLFHSTSRGETTPRLSSQEATQDHQSRADAHPTDPNPAHPQPHNAPRAHGKVATSSPAHTSPAAPAAHPSPHTRNHH